MLGIKKPRDDTMQRKAFMLYPNDTMKMVWDIFISIVLLISCFTTPFDLAFANLINDYPSYRIFGNVIDGLFLLDIFISFFSATQNTEFKTIDSRKKIAKNYLKGWFVVDLLAILPLELILSGQDVNSLVRVARIGKLYKLIKITRLVRLLKVIKQQGKLLHRLNEIFQLGAGFEKLSFFIMVFLMLSHFMACFWIFTADLSIDDMEQSEIMGETNWILQGGYEGFSTSELYIVSLYYTVTTISTVGYGDISGNNNTERIICIFLMITGVFFFSFSSGSLTNIIQNYEIMAAKD